jgi:hypothetical protein
MFRTSFKYLLMNTAGCMAFLVKMFFILSGYTQTTIFTVEIMINYLRSGHCSAVSLQHNSVIVTSLAIAYFEVGQRHCLVRLAITHSDYSKPGGLPSLGPATNYSSKKTCF